MKTNHIMSYHTKRRHRTKLRDSVSRKLDGSVKLYVSVICFRGAERRNPVISWICRVSVMFPERKCHATFPLHFSPRISVVVCFRYVFLHGFKHSIGRLEDLRSFPSIALRIHTAHNFMRDYRARIRKWRLFLYDWTSPKR